MNDTALIVAAVAAIQLLIIAFAVFCIGYFIGFKREEKKILKKNIQKAIAPTTQSEEEQRAIRDWKKFLSYDGSADTDKNSF